MADFGEDETIKQEIFKKYKWALKGLGVELNRSDVREALDQCFYDFETILREFISWALYCERNGNPLTDPSDILIRAIREQWKERPFWSDNNLADPRFQSPGTQWWHEASRGLGEDLRNQLIADINEDKYPPYVLFRNGLTLELSTAIAWSKRDCGWEKIREFGEKQTGKSEFRIDSSW